MTNGQMYNFGKKRTKANAIEHKRKNIEMPWETGNWKAKRKLRTITVVRNISGEMPGGEMLTVR